MAVRARQEARQRHLICNPRLDSADCGHRLALPVVLRVWGSGTGLMIKDHHFTQPFGAFSLKWAVPPSGTRGSGPGQQGPSSSCLEAGFQWAWSLCPCLSGGPWAAGTPTLEEVVVSPWAEPASPHVEGIHHHSQQLLVLEAPRQHLQNERLLLGAQSLEKKQPGGGHRPGPRGPRYEGRAPSGNPPEQGAEPWAQQVLSRRWCLGCSWVVMASWRQRHK